MRFEDTMQMKLMVKQMQKMRNEEKGVGLKK
jgi:hypothetical protein